MRVAFGHFHDPRPSVVLGLDPRFVRAPPLRYRRGVMRIANSFHRVMFLATSVICSSLALAQQTPPSVYAPPELPTDADGTNMGAVNLEVNVRYLTDYVYRGVEVFESPKSEDQLILQLDGKLAFDLGKLPHPFIGVFVNAAQDDPVSDFQEIRPTIGFDWTIKPIVISAGYNAYIYPDRNDFDTNEVFIKLALDKNVLFGGKTVPAPYVLAAYDFDLYDGVYLEGGIEYALPFEEIGLSLNFIGSIAYVSGWESFPKGENGTFPGFFTNPFTTEPTIDGLQHWQVGVVGEYSLNHLLDISERYGQWSLSGYLFYTDTVDDNINATNQLWGGGGLTFRY